MLLLLLLLRLRLLQKSFIASGACKQGCEEEAITIIDVVVDEHQTNAFY